MLPACLLRPQRHPEHVVDGDHRTRGNFASNMAFSRHLRAAYVRFRDIQAAAMPRTGPAVHNGIARLRSGSEGRATLGFVSPRTVALALLRQIHWR